MLRLDLHSLVREVEAAEDFRDQHLREWRRLIERYHGPAYRGGDTSEDDPENFVHEYVSLIMPRIVHDSPRVRVRAARPVSQAMTSMAPAPGAGRQGAVTVTLPAATVELPSNCDAAPSGFQ